VFRSAKAGVSVAALMMVFVMLATQLGAQPRGALIGGGVKHFQVSAEPTAVNGDVVRMLVVLKLDPGWHVSWRNPGETGLPTRLSWTLPAGVSVAGETWPVPVIAHTPVGATHTLEGDVPWIVDLRITSAVPADRLIGLTVGAGVCKDVCIPEQVTVQAVLPGTSAESRSRVKPIPAPLRSRLAADGGVLAARRVSATELCVDGPPLMAGAAGLPEFVADSGVALDAALPLRRATGSRRGAATVTIPAATQLGDRLAALFVRGASGVAATLDFRRPAPRCAAR
jgi:DsbC/DsbD-like thiol-disulfide interchange protein